MVNQAITTVWVNDEVPIEVCLFRTNGSMGGDWLITCQYLSLLRVQLMRDVCFLLPAFLLKLAQGFMITFLMARHDGKQVMHAPAHIPLKKCASTLWIDIEVLLVAFNDQFVLAITIKIGELVALPVYGSKTRAVGGIFCFNEVVVDSRTHMSHIDTAEEAMPVGVVGLCLPQLNNACLGRSTSIIHVLMDAQHFFMLVVYLRVAHQEVAPEATAHELQNVVAFLLF